MTPIDQTLSQAVKAILTAAPIGLDSSITIRASGDQEPIERPSLFAFCEDGTTPHPLLRKTTLVLRLRTRADEVTPGTGAEWHKLAADWLTANPASLRATLAPHGLQLTRFTAQSFTDTPEGERGHEYDQRWTVWIRDST